MEILEEVLITMEEQTGNGLNVQKQQTKLSALAKYERIWETTARYYQELGKPIAKRVKINKSVSLNFNNILYIQFAKDNFTKKYYVLSNTESNNVVTISLREAL